MTVLFLFLLNPRGRIFTFLFFSPGKSEYFGRKDEHESFMKQEVGGFKQRGSLCRHIKGLLLVQVFKSLNILNRL